MQFVIYSPPGTAVFHNLHSGWTVDTYKLAQLVDAQKWLVWAKTEDGQRNINRPDPEWRPGDQVEEQAPVMTIGDYMRLAGLEN